MQTIADIMTREVRTIAPHETIRHAAAMMDDLNVGALPVCEDERLIGMITDRDITVRATSVGKLPDDTLVADIMSIQVHWCFDDQTVEDVMDEMGDIQVRRIPVLDHQTKTVVGIVSLGDLATKHSAQVDRTLENVSSPSQPDIPH